MEIFTEILNDLIIEIGKPSLRELARKIGMESSQFSDYTRNTIPKIPSAIKIANFFNCSLDYLFGLSLEKGKPPQIIFNVKTFIQRYKTALDQNNISHYKFSSEIKLSESTIRKWKNGANPDTESIYKIAKGLSVSINYLIGV